MPDKNLRFTPHCDKGLEVCERHSEERSDVRIQSNITPPQPAPSRAGEQFPKYSHGFTLAEVLIALVVIGVIAAITMTTVMPNIQERVNSQRQANIVYKVTQATNLMKSNGAMVEGFASTDAFVDELQKYLKIMKRCDSDHIADCWPTKKVRTSEGKEYEVKDAKTRNQLGFSDVYKKNKNVGIVLTDGASIILTYNPAIGGIPISEPITAITTELPAGGRFQTFLEYTSNTTSGLAFVMDVNGAKGPNSETIGTKKYDIRNLNGAHFDVGCGGLKIDGICYIIPESTNRRVDCTKDTDESRKYCNMQYHSTVWDNYKAGAAATCDDMDAELLSKDELVNLCKSGKINDYVSGYFWPKGLYDCTVNFPACTDNTCYGVFSKTPKTLCKSR